MVDPYWWMRDLEDPALREYLEAENAYAEAMTEHLAPLRTTLFDEIRARVKELLDLVQLDWLAKRYPSQLSGGQRQRIALARALAIRPRILLLDEPFGALDAKVRKELRTWLRSLHQELDVTSIFVTHDQEEALEVANRVVVMDKGRIEQAGTPGDVYDNPATAFVHSFIGESIVLPVEVDDGYVRLGDKVLNIAAERGSSGPSRLFVRRHDMQVGPSGWGGLEALVVCMFLYCAMLGSINPTSAGLAMQNFGHAAGMASALIGIFLYGGGAMASVAMGSFVTPATAVPMAGLMCLAGTMGLATYLLFRRGAPG